MRPLRLELEGFTSFRERTLLDLEELDLFAITGPTGAGKSSLIDAICYALYGRIPRVNAEVSSSISLGMERMQVVMEFRANGRAYRVLRETRRKGQGNVRLEMHDGDDWQPLADRAAEVSNHIAQIVGLDFNAFTRSALLPQGQFQEFLSGKPDERRNVLEKLLRIDVYRRMAQRAGEQARSHKQRVDEIEGRLSGDLANATPVRRDQLKSTLRQAEKDAESLDARITALAEALQIARDLSNARRDVREQQTKLDEVSEKAEQARKQIEGGDAEALKLKQRAAELEAALKDHAFDEALLHIYSQASEIAVSAERSAGALQQALATLPQKEEEAAAATLAVEGARKAAAKVLEAAVKAEQALDEARRHNLAAGLQAELKVGDICPVCGEVITKLADISGSDVDEALREHSRARDAEKKAREAAAAAATKAAVAENTLAADRSQAEKLALQATEDQGRLEAALPAVKDRSSAAINAVVMQQQALRREREALTAELRQASAAIQAEDARLAEARQAIVTAQAQLDAARDGVERARKLADAAAEHLGELAREQGWPEALTELNEGRNPGEWLRTSHTACQEEQRDVHQRIGGLGREIEQVEKDIELAKELRQELTARKEQQAVADDLQKMLDARRFQAYLIGEALRSLAEDGSQKLMELSAGRYELEVAEGGVDFMVRDRWNADDLRPVRTLSGGETFLASLALALSLAETLPGLAPGRRLALESIFLDEGFGSLDSDALDRAADALDALRTEGRLVCVITHLKELAERMPARVEVIKQETGSTLIVA